MRNAQVRAARFAADMTAAELGDKIGRTRHTITSWENGRTSPTLDDLRAIAEATDTSLTYLVGDAA